MWSCPTTIGSAAAPPAEFVPGEVIVRFRDESPSTAPAASKSVLAAVKARATDMGMTYVAGAPGKEMLVACRDPQQRDAAYRAGMMPTAVMAQC